MELTRQVFAGRFEILQLDGPSSEVVMQHRQSLEDLILRSRRRDHSSLVHRLTVDPALTLSLRTLLTVVFPLPFGEPWISHVPSLMTNSLRTSSWEASAKKRQN
jgi:hypothetical protein